MISDKVGMSIHNECPAVKTAMTMFNSQKFIFLESVRASLFVTNSGIVPHLKIAAFIDLLFCFTLGMSTEV